MMLQCRGHAHSKEADPNVRQSVSSQRQVCQVFSARQLGQSLSEPIIETESSPEEGIQHISAAILIHMELEITLTSGS